MKKDYWKFDQKLIDYNQIIVLPLVARFVRQTGAYFCRADLNAARFKSAGSMMVGCALTGCSSFSEYYLAPIQLLKLPSFHH